MSRPSDWPDWDDSDRTLIAWIEGNDALLNSATYRPLGEESQPRSPFDKELVSFDIKMMEYSKLEENTCRRVEFQKGIFAFLRPGEQNALLLTLADFNERDRRPLSEILRNNPSSGLLEILADALENNLLCAPRSRHSTEHDAILKLRRDTLLVGLRLLFPGKAKKEKKTLTTRANRMAGISLDLSQEEVEKRIKRPRRAEQDAARQRTRDRRSGPSLDDLRLRVMMAIVEE
ncbi:MAG TPA: hypothetical protein VGO17_14130 [Aurantimonas sp.]|jgi:hypothetical protein|nr:hypothetical protein [Aurantimonas sp.]